MSLARAPGVKLDGGRLRCMYGKGICTQDTMHKLSRIWAAHTTWQYTTLQKISYILCKNFCAEYASYYPIEYGQQQTDCKVSKI